ncbi:hypothetical protein PIB30_077325 [Stylosanthes scabra]|uniref:Uncharacterized protein n=1 Tax=Stylosanthes scabra TaxID=79078 RepID=A0ABU6TSG5_9FABA|nr:hypothetical protein [Stylosanthes scabra]
MGHVWIKCALEPNVILVPCWQAWPSLGESWKVTFGPSVRLGSNVTHVWSSELGACFLGEALGHVWPCFGHEPNVTCLRLEGALPSFLGAWMGHVWDLTLVNNKRLEIEKNLQQAVERQGRDIAEMRKQLTLWTRNTSAREAYTCWAHQQANLNLREIPITQISDLMQTNAEKGRPIFYGCLKSDYGASTSSQADPQEPVPFQTAPSIPSFQPPHPPPN